MKVLLSMVLVFFARQACADLYRWVDPDSGSVKLSSYPPPWYNESAPDRHKPKVERIPDKAGPTPFAPGSSSGGELSALEGQRRAVLQMIEATLDEPAKPTTEAEFQRQLGIYRDVVVKLDGLDPAGSPARARDLQRFMGRMGKRIPQ